MKKFEKKREDLFNKEKEKLEVTDRFIENVESKFHEEHPEIDTIKTKITRRKKFLRKKKRVLEMYDTSYFDLDKELIQRLEELFYIESNLVEDLKNVDSIRDQQWFKKMVDNDKQSKEKLLIAFSFMDFEEQRKFIKLISELGTERADPKSVIEMVKTGYSDYVDKKLELQLKEDKILKKERIFDKTVDKMFEKYLEKQRKDSYLGDTIDKRKRKKADHDIKDVLSYKKLKSLKKDKKDLLDQSKKVNISGPILEERKYFEDNYEPKAFVFSKTKNFKYLDQYGNKYYSYIKNIPLQYEELEKIKKEDPQTYKRLYYSNRFDKNRTKVPFIVSKENEFVFYIRIFALNKGWTYEQLISVYCPSSKLVLTDKNGLKHDAKVVEFHIEKKRKIGTIIISIQ